MLNFVTELPETLEPNNIYYVQEGEGEVSHYVTDSTGTAIPVTTEALIQGYMNGLKGVSNGYAELDANQKVPINQLPNGSKPEDIDTAIGTAKNTLQIAIDGKQASLANATEVAKIGDSKYDGKPLVLLKTVDW